MCVVKQSNMVEIMHLVPSTNSGYSKVGLHKVRSPSHHFPIDPVLPTCFRNGISQTIHLPNPTEVLFINQQIGKLWLWSNHQVDIVNAKTGVVEERLENVPPVLSPLGPVFKPLLTKGSFLFCYDSPFSIVVSDF